MTDTAGMDRPRSLGRMLVGNILKSTARRHPQREALYCVGTGRRFSYAQLNERCNRLANGLLGLGLPRGTVVAFLCANRAEIIEVYFALAKSGLIGLPLNYRLAPAEIMTLIGSMRAAVLICDARFAAVQQQLQAQAEPPQVTLWIGEGVPNGCIGYEDLLARASGDEPAVDVREEDVFYYNLTSGTTGLPKCYAITQFNLAALESTVIGYDLRPEDVFLNVFPAFGRVGFGWSLIAILMGARNVLMDFDAPVVLKLIETERVTFTNLVPTMAALLLARPELDRRKLASLRAISFVGAMLPPVIRDQALDRLCPRLYESYGLQEAGNLTISTPEDRAVAPDSVGKPALFADVRIIDNTGTDVKAGEIGEIIGRSPNGITSYHDNPAKNAEAFREGWFHTGDLGRFDEQGYLYLCGRVKDMIISGGQNIHSSEIEAMLLTISGISECAVFGLPDPLWGETVAAAIVSTDDALTGEMIQDACRAHLAGFKVPRKIFFQRDPLPRTATGKVQKFLLVERYGQAGK